MTTPNQRWRDHRRRAEGDSIGGRVSDVFPSGESVQTTTELMRNVMRNLAVHADITVHRRDGEPADPSEFHLHACRHSLVNYMLANEDIRIINEDIRIMDVRNCLRHRSVIMTERVYDHFQRQ